MNNCTGDWFRHACHAQQYLCVDTAESVSVAPGCCCRSEPNTVAQHTDINPSCDALSSGLPSHLLPTKIHAQLASDTHKQHTTCTLYWVTPMWHDGINRQAAVNCSAASLSQGIPPQSCHLLQLLACFPVLPWPPVRAGAVLTGGTSSRSCECSPSFGVGLAPAASDVLGHVMHAPGVLKLAIGMPLLPPPRHLLPPPCLGRQPLLQAADPFCS